MRGYLIAFVSACAAVLLLVAAINCLVDVNGTYHLAERDTFAASYVAALRSSPNGLVFSPFERSVKLALLRATDADCYITGSSHEMQISLANFAPSKPICHRLVNIAVSGASFEDLVTDIGELTRHPALRTLYIGIGPWMLRRGADQRWMEEREALLRACDTLGLASGAYRSTAVDRLKLVRNAINGQYLWRNLQALFDRQPPILAADRRADDDAVMRPDGSLQYSPQFLVGKPPEPQLVGDGSYKIGEPYADPSVVEDLTVALTVLALRNVHMVFVLMPYHPKVMSCRGAGVCASMTAVVRAIQGLAWRVGGDVLGSYDPAVSALSWRDFYDDMHVSAQAIVKLNWRSQAVAPGPVPPTARRVPLED